MIIDTGGASGVVRWYPIYLISSLQIMALSPWSFGASVGIASRQYRAITPARKWLPNGTSGAVVSHA